MSELNTSVESAIKVHGGSSELSRRSKILIVCGAFPPLRLAEADHIYWLADELSQHGEISFLTHKDYRPLNGARFTLLPEVTNWGWGSLRAFGRVMRRIRPDAVFFFHFPAIYDAHPAVTYMPLVSKFICPKARVATMFSIIHYVDGKSRFNRLVCRALSTATGNRLSRFLGSFVSTSDEIVVMSASHERALKEGHPRMKVAVRLVPPPLLLRMCQESREVCRANGRELLGIAADVTVITFFGRIYATKGIDVLLAAWDLFSSMTSRRCCLVLVGGAGAIEENDTKVLVDAIIQRTVRHVANFEVKWIGEFDHDSKQPSQVLYASDLAVLPFVGGAGLNNSSLVAVGAHNLPVVTTPRPNGDASLRHLENVYLVPPRDAKALALAIHEMIESPQLLERLRNGLRETVAPFVSWAHSAAQIAAALDI